MRSIFRRLLLRPRLQIFTVILFSVIITLTFSIFNIEHNIDKKQFSDLLVLFAQLSGILLGFLAGFFFFIFQSKESLKMQWFLEYKRTIDDLVDRFTHLPDHLYYLSAPLGRIIHKLEGVTIDDFPNDRLKDCLDDLEKIIKEENPVDPIFNREILYIVAKTEEYSNKINLTVIGVWTSFALINSIYKQLAILALSITLLFITTALKTNFHPEMMLGLSIAMGLYTLTGFAELVVHIAYFYKNRLSEIPDGK